MIERRNVQKRAKVSLFHGCGLSQGGKLNNFTAVIPIYPDLDSLQITEFIQGLRRPREFRTNEDVPKTCLRFRPYKINFGCILCEEESSCFRNVVHVYV
jgi:hypothetical protein